MSEQQAQKSDTITIKKDALWKYSTFVLAGIVILGAIIMILPNAPPTTGDVVDQGAEELARVDAKVLESDQFIKGSADSEVIIIEYSDFECPYCQRAYVDAIAQIKTNYDDSEVAIIYRHFPLTSIHPQAQKAAEATECAGEQGAFVEMHDMLFDRGVTGGTAAFKTYASQLGLNTGEFNTCLDSGKYAEKINEDLTLGQSQGVRGTPGFIVDGTVVSGAQPFSVFKQIIDASLA